LNLTQYLNVDFHRFWLILNLLGIIFTIYALDNVVLPDFSPTHQSNKYLISLDVIKCFSSVLIFGLLLFT
jgi:hypothetical protein